MDTDCHEAVIDLMESQKSIVKKGGTMRLGAWDCELKTDSKAAVAYQEKIVSERHRHRYEFNNDFVDRIFDKNFIIAGTNPDTGLVEIIEYNDHPWFVGVQFHPEYKSTVSNPHPLFVAFVQASLLQKAKK
jgi:CTP synthase